MFIKISAKLMRPKISHWTGVKYIILTCVKYFVGYNTGRVI